MLKKVICTIVTVATMTSSPGLLSAQQSRQDVGREGGRRREGDRGREGERGREATPSLEWVVDGLTLSDETREKAMQLIRDYQNKVRRLSDTAESNLMEKLKIFLDDADFRTLRTNMNQQLSGEQDGQRGIQTADLVERLIAFDKDNDGSVTRSELPERMRSLVDRGDANKDGSLNRQEIEALATGDEPRNERREPEGRTGGEGRTAARESTGFSFRQIERALAPMKSSAASFELASAVLKSARDEAGKDTERLRMDLLTNLGKIVNREDQSKLKTALERGPVIGEQPRRGAERGRDATNRH